MKNILTTLKERGLVKQVVFEEELNNLLTNEKVNFYIGYDPTADSLTIGHYLTIILASHMQKAGHRPFLLMGGATGLIGDPSGRSDMRKMLTKEQVNHNISCFKKQISRLISFEGENGAVIVNNIDWLGNLNYIDFLRDVGTNLSVNKMLSCECFKSRWDKGLSFLEFNYMPMQAYDFYHLCKEKNVVLEIGGDDQWSNILAGADLIRRKLQKPAFGLTSPLLTKADGTKMGKTAGGAIWLNKEKTSAYDLFQYLRNVEDVKTNELLKFLTFLPVEEIDELTKFKDERMNKAKEILAYEVVKDIHGKEEADKALEMAKGAFSGSGEMPTQNVKNIIGMKITDLLLALKICLSNGEAKRLIESGAVKINERTIIDIVDTVNQNDLNGNFIELHKGKKTHIKVINE